MKVYGFDSIAPMLESDGYVLKLLANDSGVVLFPHTIEHRDATQPGIMYADDSHGNALAAMVKNLAGSSSAFIAISPTNALRH